MKKKVNWNDKNLITQTVLDSNGYSDVLKALGLRPVSANTTTLKKYIELYNISTAHFNQRMVVSTPIVKQTSVLSDVERNSINPRVEIIGEVTDPHKGVGIELDWNDAFVKYLRDNGYTGASDEAVVQYYITHLMQNISERMKESTGSEYAG